jgi:hypothetical protein
MADFNTSKVDGDTVAAAEWNQLASVDNFITTSGQTPSTGNLNQIGIGSARYSSGGQFFTDSGTANAYILAPVSPFKAPVSATEGYFNGMTIRFRAGNANSGASTVNVNSAGVKNLKKEDGSTDLAAGDIPTNIDVMFRYNGTSFVLVIGVSDASTTVKGIVELLTNAELAAGIDTTRAATAAAIASLYPNITIGSQNSISFPIKDGGAFKKFTIKSGVTGNLSSGNPGTTITFASAFTGGVTGASVAATTYTGVAEANNAIPSLTLSNIVLTVGGNTPQPYRWIVFGYDN